MNVDQKRKALASILYDQSHATLSDTRINECWIVLTSRQELDKFYSDNLTLNQVKPK